MHIRKLLTTIACLVAASVAAASLAGEEGWREQESAYEAARAAVQRGEALPLQQVMAHLHRIAPGKIVATHYEYEFERWVYEFKIVDAEGQLRKVHLDARTGELVMVSDY